MFSTTGVSASVIPGLFFVAPSACGVPAAKTNDSAGLEGKAALEDR